MSNLQTSPNELIQCLTLGVATTLEKRPGITDVDLSEYPAADRKTIIGWEQRNCCVMPDDLKNFYQTTDGLLLTWKVESFDDSRQPRTIGKMNINPICELKRIYSSTSTEKLLNKVSLADADYRTDSEDEDESNRKYRNQPHFDSRTKFFELDDCNRSGKVCLVYLQTTKSELSKPKTEIWFLDRALQWWLISKDFTTYYRLMLMHLGLPHWQYAFTSIGLPQKSKQWFNLYAPVRLNLNGEHGTDIQSTELVVPSVKVDFNRVFKGKPAEKKQQKLTNQNTAANKKKLNQQSLASRSVSLLRNFNRSSKPWT